MNLLYQTNNLIYIFKYGLLHILQVKIDLYFQWYYTFRLFGAIYVHSVLVVHETQRLSNCYDSDRSHTFPPSRLICSFLNLPPDFTLSSTCLLHVIFGRSRFRCLFTPSIIAFFSILSSSILITCPYHLTPFAFAILSNVYFKPNISISSSIFFLFTNFTPHIDLTMALSVLLKIVISLYLKRHVSLPKRCCRLPLLVYESSAATAAASECKTAGAAAILKKKKVKSTKAF